MAAAGLTARGIAALRAGDRAAARALLAAAVREDPADALAWLWLSGALDDPAAQRQCLERALALDPACAPARAGLAALGAAGGHAGPPLRAPDAMYGRPHVPVPAPTRAPVSAPSPPPPGAHAGAPLRPADGVASGPASPITAPATLGAPWRLIWRRPRTAFRAALARPSPWAPWPPVALAGVGAALGWAAWRDLGVSLGAGELLALAVVAGAPLGLAALLLSGVLLRTGGRALGGRAGAAEVRAVLGLALAPAAAGLPLWLAQLALLPGATFGAAQGPAQGLLASTCGAAHAALWGWSAALSVVGLAEAHGLTLRRAAASWLLAALAALAGAAALLGAAALAIWLLGG